MDAIAEWTATQQRVIDLVDAVGNDYAKTTVVPACPDWSVHNLLSHMVGLTSDVVNGDEADDHNADWTQKQVDSRSGNTLAAVVEEWRALTVPMQTWMRENDSRPLGDVVIHEQDLRGALKQSGAQDTEALRSLRDMFADQLRESVEDLPPLELRGNHWVWKSDPRSEAHTVLEASDFDLTRALLSRRSAAQLTGWTIAGDISQYLDSLEKLGPLPEQDLTETF